LFDELEDLGDLFDLGQSLADRSKYNTQQAIEAIRKELPQTEEITQILKFIEKSERGIIR